MASYNPSFSRDARGKFNPELGFVSIKGGTDAYLLEDELNELQWIQNEARAELVRKMTNSGCMQFSDFVDNLTPGGLKELSSTNLNSFLLGGFDTVLNGYLAYIDKSDLTGNIITLPEPSTTGLRYDFVFLEFWFKELKNYEAIKKFGGINNDPIIYQLIDSRMGVETARRIQLQWNIRAVANIDTTYVSGFTDSFGNINYNIHPKGLNLNEFVENSFSLSSKDTNLYISGNGTTDSSKFGVADGYIYAIPLFFVKRLNSGTYDENTNPDGSVNWFDNTSITTRPDGKFSNIIYADQIIDIRPKIAIGRKQLDSVYIDKLEFNGFKDDMQLINTQIQDKFTNINGDITGIQTQINELIRLQFEEVGPRLADAEFKINNLQLDFANLNNGVNTVLSRVNSVDERLTIVENELKKLGIDLSFSNLLYYGADMTFNNIMSMGGQILEDQTINSTGVTVLSNYKAGPNNYSLLYTAEASPSGKLGDVWVEKADIAALFKNSGYGGIQVNTAVVKHTGDIISVAGDNVFNGMDGVHIDRILNPDDFLFVLPTSNVYGTIGEIYYSTDANGFTIYNTGHAGTTFDYIIINITNMRNVELTSISYGGTSTITGVYGENFKAFIGPATIPNNQGGIGDVTISRSLNTITIYNTGSCTDNTVTAQCLIFKDVTSNP
jgi:hypothetical protein